MPFETVIALAHPYLAVPHSLLHTRLQVTRLALLKAVTTNGLNSIVHLSDHLRFFGGQRRLPDLRRHARSVLLRLFVQHLKRCTTRRPHKGVEPRFGFVELQILKCLVTFRFYTLNYRRHCHLHFIPLRCSSPAKPVHFEAVFPSALLPTFSGLGFGQTSGHPHPRDRPV